MTILISFVAFSTSFGNGWKPTILILLTDYYNVGCG
jgi:hypothetical protein